MSQLRFRRFALATSAVALCAGLAAPAFAADTAPAPAAASDQSTIRNTDDIVVTGTKVNQATPITSSVHTFEPQSIVSRSIIENSIAPTADYSQVVLLTPSAALQPSSGNGVGLGDAKVSLRGFTDGQYNITIDGIPFGDTNDPTHHSTSYFPNGTYERIIVDRGPGSATDLGQASYGGQVHIISREATDKFFIENQAVYGSFETWMERLTINTGAIKALGGLKLVGVGEYKTTNGALTHESGDWTNLFLKAELPIGSDAKLSFVTAYNHSPFHQSDAGGGATQAQIAKYGIDFGGIDPSQAAGSGYTNARTDWNWEIKTTDFEIARLQWNVAPQVQIDNKAYTYFYKNFTVSTEDSTTPCATLSSATQCSGPGYTNAKGMGAGIGGSGGSAIAGDIPGYTKLNMYRVMGDILQATWANPLGVLKAGLWYEHATTRRFRYDYDFTTASAAGGLGDEYFNISIMNNGSNFNWKEKAGGVHYEADGTTPIPAYIKYDEHSGWNQVQFFGEMAFKLDNDKLTLTPGVKVQTFTRFINTPIASQSARVGVYAHENYRPTLPYFTANYLIEPNLSVYAQFAKGFLIPSLSASLETSGANNATVPLDPKPTKTTNWQGGVVYAGNRLNIDADAYYIISSNSSYLDPTNNQVTINANPARYQGIEGQVSYVIVPNLTALANGTVMSSKDEVTGQWLPQAPRNTETLGLLYNDGTFNFSYLHKFTGTQPGSGVAAYNYGVLAASAKWKNYSLGVSVTNLWNSQPIVVSSGGLYIFQTRRAFQASFKMRF